jgi:ElaB/YqjD/DUF883 family membrane-anchored ribosome-binding protein
MDTTYDSSDKRLKSDVKDGARNVKNVVSDEFKNFVSDVEDVVKGVSHVSDADVARVRAKIQSALTSTKDGVEITAANLTKRAREAATQADSYVRESPWQAIGIGAAIAALIGVSVGILAARR